MRKKITKIVKVLCMTVLCSMLMVQTALAAESPSVSIPVEILLEGTLPETAEEFTVKMVADDASYPMPEGSEDGVYTMMTTAEESKDFPAIIYDNRGIYTYKISQEAGKNPKCTYDATVYNLTVYVTNAEDGSGLEVTAVLYPEGESDKVAEVSFKNIYETEPVPEDQPKTGDGANTTLYLSLIGISVAVIAMSIVSRRKVER